MPANQPTLMERLELLAINLIATAILSVLLENFVGIPRPYQLESGLFSWCPPGFAFPSGDIANAFSFVFPFIGNSLFPISYFIALLVSWSQVSQGLHSLLDIGGGLAVAGLGYSIAEAAILKRKKVINRRNELPRKAAHIVSNLSACLLIWLIGIPIVSSLFLAATCIGILMIHLTINGINLPGIGKWLKSVGREGEVPGEGAMYNALGVLFVLGLLRGDPIEAICVIIVLALGDGLATYFGTIYGKHKLPWNKKKTLEGTLGFAAGAMVALLILPAPVTILVVLIATVIESLPLRVNDNITLPMASSIIYYFA